ncbi:hypothetical protein THASP1DRAFT_30486 [Thamnocephalis sphaerospora]|uniref:Uncharacterized protein n=1 Tax=Thamnocephalis sphaerospora TaxID=78915 RepID=A0A4P9XP20_9FUNG|nr:hypothetical protein THASP1DRAFT_30486 [Thamnocephalis sphaerospora]|eukprot:RKP07708.1 hypothetical protein THASP1DRAFT_30486 [Thamnocephalis sphaerospora]
MTTLLIDCHAHLYPPYYPVRRDKDGDEDDEGAQAVADALSDARNPICVVIVTECLDDWHAVCRLLARRPELAVRTALCVGVHPMQRTDAPELGSGSTMRSVRMHDLTATLAWWQTQQTAADARIVGVGEIGLDFSPHILATHPEGVEAARTEQRAVFAAQLAVARRLQLPVNVHSRQAGRHALEVLREAGYGAAAADVAAQDDNGDEVHGVLLHAFDGRPRYIREGLALGAYFSVAPSLARDPLLERLVAQVPLDRLVLESDAPALGMARGEPSAPHQISWVCQRIAELKGVTTAQVAAATTANALRLFPRLRPHLAVAAHISIAHHTATHGPLV